MASVFNPTYYSAERDYICAVCLKTELQAESYKFEPRMYFYGFRRRNFMKVNIFVIFVQDPHTLTRTPLLVCVVNNIYIPFVRHQEHGWDM